MTPWTVLGWMLVGLGGLVSGVVAAALLVGLAKSFRRQAPPAVELQCGVCKIRPAAYATESGLRCVQHLVSDRSTREAFARRVSND